MPLEKAIFFLSPRGISSPVNALVTLSTGTLSPVSDDSCILRFMASVSLMSAGITAPVSRMTMSPGTSSLVFTSEMAPSRSTFDRGDASSFKASSEVSAFFSWTAPISALTSRMPSMIYVSRSPSPSITPTTPEMAAAIRRTIIMKLLNCSRNIRRKLFFDFDSSWLKPYCSCLFFTSAVVSPDDSLAPSSLIRSAASCLYASVICLFR